MSTTHLLVAPERCCWWSSSCCAGRRADRRPPRPRADLRRASRRSAGALQGVEAEHLRPLEGAVKAINAQFDIILGALPGIARKAAIVAERRPR